MRLPVDPPLTLDSDSQLMLRIHLCSSGQMDGLVGSTAAKMPHLSREVAVSEAPEGMLWLSRGTSILERAWPDSPRLRCGPFMWITVDVPSGKLT